MARQHPAGQGFTHTHTRTGSLAKIAETPQVVYKRFRDSLRAQVMAVLTIVTTVFAIVFTVGLLLHGNTKAKQGDFIERVAVQQDGVGPHFVTVVMLRCGAD